MWCLVDLPSGIRIAVTCDPKARGQECLNKVCSDLKIICENEYFGLAYQKNTNSSIIINEPNTKQWINLRNPLNQYGNDREHFLLSLRVKFWVPGHLILQDNVKDIFFLQSRSDLLEGRLLASSWTNAAKLGALLAQADDIEFSNECLKENLTIVSENINKINNDDAVPGGQKRRACKRKSTAETVCIENNNDKVNNRLKNIYEKYVIYPEDKSEQMPIDFLSLIAKEHKVLNSLNMPAKSAKYWLLEEISKLNGFGEEVFEGTMMHDASRKVEFRIGPHGIVILNGSNRQRIPFGAVQSAKPNRRNFRLTYLSEDNESTCLNVKFSCHNTAAAVYRTLTEKHAFYSCETVRSAVTQQFIRDLKGTIVSMFNEDTEFGKRYVFDIQRTCREVYDNARRVLHNKTNISLEPELLSDAGSLTTNLSTEQNNAIEKALMGRMKEMLNCRICMDREINTIYIKCGHIISCDTCAKKCERCPLCRANITTVKKIYLPSEFRTVDNNIVSV